ncbi:MAG: NAD(P)/FAD-dependent oxidoreductase [Firmicutes bacterium]|nr:NAD(P)/FAD-dependent oxidoreductase [Bacillota bacterium]
MEDVIIIGGGVSGCSLLYALSRYKGNFLLLEKENDVAMGSTKANSGIAHAGYDPEPGTKMAEHNVQGNAWIRANAKKLGIPFVQTGSLVVAFDEEEKLTLQSLLERGKANGVPDLSIIEGQELFLLEPNLSRDALAALYAKTTGVVDPWALSFAQAECAILGGGKVQLETEVTGISKQDGYFVVDTNKGRFEAKFVVNAAGVYSDEISTMVETPHFAIKPKNGEYFLLDTSEKGIVGTVVFPCPSKLGKGVLVAPTAHGNIIVGPDAKDSGKEDTSVTAEGLDYVRQRATKCIPSLNLRASIRNFTGVRANSDQSDFVIGESLETAGFFNVAGIKSPGLTSAVSIAQEMVDLLFKAGLKKSLNAKFVRSRRVARLHEMSDTAKKLQIAKDPKHGNIVCRCRQVTEGEIADTFLRPLPPRSVDAVKRRVQTGMGRCQGGFCTPKVVELLAEHYGVDMKEIPQDKAGTYIVDGDAK